jgi:excisionase family DNA binding protein
MADERPLISPMGIIYTVAEVARLLQVSPRTVQRLIHQGQLKSRRVGRIHRILGKDLQAFLGECPEPPT